MIQKFLILAAAVSLSAGLAACASDEMKGSLPSAKPAAAGEAPAGEDMAAEDMAAEDMAAEDMAAEDMAAEDMAAEDMAAEDMAAEDMAAEDMTPAETAGEDMAPAETAGEDMATEEVASEEMTAEEVSPEGVETEETVTETVMTEEEVPPPEETLEARLTEREMLRDVRKGSYAIRYCSDITDVNLKTFDDCVTGQLTTAQSDGNLTESYQLGADYQAWLFLGEHAGEMREGGYEWTREYRMLFKSRAKYQKSVQSLIQRTGLDEKEVCAQLKGDC